jgi:curved DNA-binding protein CbpA/Tfp pilus assembly protein PilF
VSQNHYQVLGVAPDAPAADIKRAYRQLVVRYHPDKHGGDVRFEDQFKAVAVAYGVLSDPGKRATYDFQLAQAARRAREAQRAQQHRPAAQHVYGVPMPAPAPLRTRPPAGARERHYQRIPKQRARFNTRDWLLTGALLLGIVVFSLAVKVTMDRVTASSNYHDGLRAYAHGQWASAYTFLEESLHFRPEHAPTLARLGELDLLINHDPRGARASFQAALLHPQSPRSQATLYYFLGRSEALLGHPGLAEIHFTRALEFDSTRSSAYLARGETRLLDLKQTTRAINDFSTGLEQRQRTGQAPAWRYVQLRGLAYTSLGQYAEARADYFRVIRAKPTDGRTHFLLGRLAARTGDSTAACEFYSRAVRLGYDYARTAQRSCIAKPLPQPKPRIVPPAPARPKSKKPPLARSQRRLPKVVAK